MTDTQPIIIKGVVLIQSQHDLHLCLPLTDNKKEILYQCPLCNYVTPAKSRLKHHVVVHTHHKLYKCNICHSRFEQFSSMQNHRRLKHSDITKSYKCEDCDMAFKKRCILKIHRLYRHINIKPHKCTECDYSCVQISALRRHMQIHTNVKPYKCTECEFSCGHRSSLRRHMRIHINDLQPTKLIKPLVCPYCGKTFKALGQFKGHRRYCTFKIKPYKCSECDYSCTTNGCLRRHMIRHEGKRKDHICESSDYESTSDSHSQTMSNNVKIEENSINIANFEVKIE